MAGGDIRREPQTVEVLLSEVMGALQRARRMRRSALKPIIAKPFTAADEP